MEYLFGFGLRLFLLWKTVTFPLKEKENQEREETLLSDTTIYHAVSIIHCNFKKDHMIHHPKESQQKSMHTHVQLHMCEHK